MDGATTTTEMADLQFRWNFFESFFDTFASNCPGFNQEDQNDEDWDFCIEIYVTYAYPASLEVRRLIRGEGPGALRQILPTVLIATTSFSAEFSIGIFSLAHKYLKLMESWVVIVKQRRDDAMELVRLRSQFEETFLSVEVDVLATQKGSKIVAFTLVPLADEAALLRLFTTQNTYIELPVEKLIVQISQLDLKVNRMMTLGGGYYKKKHSDNTEIFFEWREYCRLSCLDCQITS